MSQLSLSSVLKSLLRRSTLANIVASFIAISVVSYLIHIGDTEDLKFIIGLALGYLFKERIFKNEHQD